MMVLASVLAVAVGGALGALGRWGLSLLAQRLITRRGVVTVPWWTLAATVLGCFVMGVVVTWFGGAAQGGTRVAYLLLGTGLAGSMSVVSVVGLEVVELGRRGNVVLALGYTLVSAGAGLAALWLGLVLAS